MPPTQSPHTTQSTKTTVCLVCVCVVESIHDMPVIMLVLLRTCRALRAACTVLVSAPEASTALRLRTRLDLPLAAPAPAAPAGLLLAWLLPGFSDTCIVEVATTTTQTERMLHRCIL